MAPGVFQIGMNVPGRRRPTTPVHRRRPLGGRRREEASSPLQGVGMRRSRRRRERSDAGEPAEVVRDDVELAAPDRLVRGCGPTPAASPCGRSRATGRPRRRRARARSGTGLPVMPAAISASSARLTGGGVTVVDAPARRGTGPSNTAAIAFASSGRYEKVIRPSAPSSRRTPSVSNQPGISSAYIPLRIAVHGTPDAASIARSRRGSARGERGHRRPPGGTTGRRCGPLRPNGRVDEGLMQRHSALGPSWRLTMNTRSPSRRARRDSRAARSRPGRAPPRAGRARERSRTRRRIGSQRSASSSATSLPTCPVEPVNDDHARRGA